MGLIERIGRKLENVFPNDFCGLSFKTITNGTFFPVLLHGFIGTVIPVLDNLLHQFDFLLCHSLANFIGLARRKAGHLHGNLHDLLLVHHGAIGFGQNIMQTRIVVNRLFSTIHAVNIAGHHSRSQRTGTIEGDKCDDVFELGWTHALDGCRHTCGFNLKNPRGSTFTHQSIDFRILKGYLVNVNIDIKICLDVFERARNDRQSSKPQKVHLQKTHVRNRMAFELGNFNLTFGIHLCGYVIVDGRGSNEDGTCMNTLAAMQALNGKSGIDYFPRSFLGVVCFLKIRIVKIVFFTVTLVKHLGKLRLGII